MDEAGSKFMCAAPEKAASATAASLHAELKQAHEALIRAIAELEKITHSAAPKERRFTDVRWKLSRASLNRRMLWGRILAFLLPLVGEPGAADLRRLQESDIELLRTSIRHVARWTTENALADWRGYCEASRVMRGKMGAAMEEEKRLLYPMLKAVSRGPADTARSEPVARRSSGQARTKQDA